MVVTIQVPYGEIAVPAQTVARLEEWARWARPRMGMSSHGHCASAEGRFVSVYPDADRNHAIQPDLPAVLAVERVVCNPLFPRMPREIIRRHFVLCAAPLDITRALGIRRCSYGHELQRSIKMIKNRLTRN